jgi:2'-5' RNA ligase
MVRDRAARPEAAPLRLFVAVDVPHDARLAIERAIDPFREAFPKARWVPIENWHVTLKFLGRTWPRLVEWVHDRVRDVAASQDGFLVRLSGLGAFPSPRRARVVWAGLEDPSNRLAEIALALDAAMVREFEAEKRAFTPHLTVARSDPPIALPADFAEVPVASEAFAIDGLVLYRSHLRRPAPRYEPLGTFPLR